MTTLRVLAVLGGAAVLVAVGAGIAVPRRPAPRVAERPAATVVPASVHIPASSPAPQSRAAVAPGILARAVEARALERAPSCPAPAATPDPATCPAPRDAVEIQWDVRKDP